ncbi:hypothetical protein PHYSODRAFT_335951 [Phytophthora sojae]|uniref:Uncharacterized protein n=1 Tax=Phytophthora sojae (strain P6497) TaxID=1094619 RepID=G4ZR81_PHYSP|nr:hypothetical protein PHYSODRAFT_335951 [Phytophthora sojae]EGZ14303.1 hypothetical protein PHYSODRAFT_335951 [Phytophthora sojae]|eukprot:XP_009531732.1 hypothetical protein PHYSODRAFT_335951 [Phytophthora sojae]
MNPSNLQQEMDALNTRGAELKKMIDDTHPVARIAEEKAKKFASDYKGVQAEEAEKIAEASAKTEEKVRKMTAKLKAAKEEAQLTSLKREWLVKREKAFGDMDRARKENVDISSKLIELERQYLNTQRHYQELRDQLQTVNGVADIKLE